MIMTDADHHVATVLSAVTATVIEALVGLTMMTVADTTVLRVAEDPSMTTRRLHVPVVMRILIVVIILHQQIPI
jgi:hypothetical protein